MKFILVNKYGHYLYKKHQEMIYLSQDKTKSLVLSKKEALAISSEYDVSLEPYLNG